MAGRAPLQGRPRGSGSTVSRKQRPPLKSADLEGGPQSDDDARGEGGYRRHPGGAMNFLNHVADIANILAHRASSMVWEPFDLQAPSGCVLLAPRLMLTR